MQKSQRPWCWLQKLGVIGLVCLVQGACASQKAVPTASSTYCANYSGEPVNLDNLQVSRIDEIRPSFDGFNILEGPLWHQGALYYSNLGSKDGVSNQGRIWRWQPGAKPELWLPESDAGTNGLAKTLAGEIVAGRQLNGALVAIDSDTKKLRHLTSEYEDKRFNSPNDLVIADDGSVYFTDPNWNTPSNVDKKTIQGGGEPGTMAPGQRVYRLSPDGTVSVLPITEQVKPLRDKPNGIVLSLDESQLIVGGLQGLWVFDLANGWPTNPKKVHDQQVDGLGKDCAGNIYVTTKRKDAQGTEMHIVLVLDQQLKEIGFIRVRGAQLVTNVAFGGSNGKTLFITSLGATRVDPSALCDGMPCDPASIYHVPMNIPGFPY